MCLAMRRKMTVGDLSAVRHRRAPGLLTARQLPVLGGHRGRRLRHHRGEGASSAAWARTSSIPPWGGRAFIMLFWPSAVTRFTTDSVSAGAFGGRRHRRQRSPQCRTCTWAPCPQTRASSTCSSATTAAASERSAPLRLLIGFAWLLYRKVISWRIPVAYIGTVAVLSLVFLQGRQRAHPGCSYSVHGRRRDARRHLHGHRLCHQPRPCPAAQLIYGIGCGVADHHHPLLRYPSRRA